MDAGCILCPAFFLAPAEWNSHAGAMCNTHSAFLLRVLILAAAVSQAYGEPVAGTVSAGVRKVEDVVIYKDDQFYSSFLRW